MDYNKCITVVWDVDMGEAVQERGQGGNGKSPVLPLNFAVNLQLL